MLTRKEASLKNPDQETQHNDCMKIFDPCKAKSENSPGQHKKAEPARRADISLHNPIGRDVEQCIGDTKDRQNQRVICGAHACFLKKRVAGFLVEDLSISNVCSIKIVEQVYKSAKWHQAHIDFPSETFLVFRVVFNGDRLDIEVGSQFG